MALVSVIMPVYNGERYLASAVESILDQTLKDLKFIAIDDGSKDRSLAILTSYAQLDHRLTVLARPHEGLVNALNAGLAATESVYVARMDADDISLADRLEKQVAYLDEHTDCVALGCSILEIDPDGEPLGVARNPLLHEEIEKELLVGCGGALPHPSVMFRRSSLEAVGQYRGFPAEDLDLYLRLGEIGRLANLDEVLLQYRLHSFSVNMTRKSEMREAAILAIASAYKRRNWYGFREDSVRNSWLPSAELRAHWACKALYSGHYKTSRKHIWKALRQRPGCLRYWYVLALTYKRTWFGPPSVGADGRAGVANT
jgi:glycosyltransferase involved in cell wall biosynthesis